jgi:hypothetical protein
MTNELLGTDRITEEPLQFLARVGEVFAEFGEHTQDSGNVSYGVAVRDGRRYFVKTAGRPDDPRPFLDHPARVALLRNAARLNAGLQHRALPALHAMIESPCGPLLIYTWVDGELIGVPRARRDDPASSYQRFRALPAATILRCLDTLFDLHALLVAGGWVACDFYDGSLIYDFDSDRMHVVDLDSYHHGPFTNEMGRMFGSSRFMAPEEFERGATIDQRTTVYTLGRTALLFLGDGTNARHAFRASDALHAVIERACRTRPDSRYPTFASFYSAWQRARRLTGS